MHAVCIAYGPGTKPKASDFGLHPLWANLGGSLTQFLPTGALLTLFPDALYPVI